MPLNASLNELEVSGLIHLLQIQPELAYAFRHALLQEVAYDSLIKADRRSLHLAAGEALEAVHAEQVATREFAPLLAWHFLEAGQTERALHYYTLAGDAAYSVYANAEAIHHYGHALALATAGAVKVDREQVLHLYSCRGRAFELTGRFAEAEQTYQNLAARGAQAGDRLLELEGIGRQATLYAVPTTSMDASRAEELAGQALALARQLGDQAAEVRSLWNLSNVAKFSNRPEAAIEYGEQAIAIARAAGLREQLALALNDVYSNYWTLGRLDRAAETVEEAQGLWREQGNLPLLADSLVNVGQIHMFGGRLELADQYLSEAIQIGRSIGNPWGQAFGLWTIGYLYHERGDWGAAIAALEESLPLAYEAGFVVNQVLAPGGLALIFTELGDPERGLDLVRQALARAGEVLPSHRAACVAILAQVQLSLGQVELAGQTIAEADSASGGLRGDLTVTLRRIQLDILLAQGHYALVAEQAEMALVMLERFGATLHLPDALRHRGLGLMGLGQLPEARQALEAGCTLARELGLRRAGWHLLTALYRLERQSGEVERAEAVRQEAQALVEQFAAGLAEPGLRAKFLSLPQVQDLRGGAQIG